MNDLRNSIAAGTAALARRVAALEFGQVRRWLPLAAVLVIAGCSWFGEESTPATKQTTPPAGTAQAKAPEPGEGEAMEAKPAGSQAGSTQTAEATPPAGATTPDINSVPNEAPKPSIADLNQTQQGLGADTANAQHTDQTLTMPNESAERPAPPAPETGQVAAVSPTAPETAPVAPAVTPEAQTPQAQPAPEAGQVAGVAPETPAAPAAPETPLPAPTEQVATAGTPEPGSKPFEPSGPLALAPGSLARNPQEAAINSAPMPGGGNAGGVTVDYSVLNGLQSGQATSYQAAAPAMAPVAAAPMPSGQVAGVGQAVGYVYFGDGSAGLSEADRNVLRQVAELQRIQGGVLRIIGHASQRTGNLDALAQDQVNHRVSLERATAVARALVNMGVQPILVQVAAAGDNQTLYAESTPAGEAGNRRAEVFLSAN